MELLLPMRRQNPITLQNLHKFDTLINLYSIEKREFFLSKRGINF
ncbi:MAG: hypothetical protein G01um101433_111 [Parcubacteria group bacterium Gr01-1014_33]|nr:MAG: hypothetical protein G01um101433_111 [Parcubacteria group bacterium Gr01-1014_33]